MQTTCSGENKTSVKDWVQAQIKEEENENPRSRSAKLRIAEKL